MKPENWAFYSDIIKVGRYTFGYFHSELDCFFCFLFQNFVPTFGQIHSSILALCKLGAFTKAAINLSK